MDLNFFSIALPEALTDCKKYIVHFNTFSLSMMYSYPLLSLIHYVGQSRFVLCLFFVMIDQHQQTVLSCLTVKLCILCSVLSCLPIVEGNGESCIFVLSINFVFLKSHSRNYELYFILVCL